MSWFSSNYDKALLAGGGLISLGLLYFGWSQSQLSGKEFSDRLMGGGKIKTGVEGAEEIAFTSQSMTLDHGIKRPVAEDGRLVDMMTGVPLFIKRDTNGQAIDLFKDQPVHPPIPNDWWLKYGVDPGFADSPLQDPDGDGFTNLEEFRGGTDPTDPSSHPALIGKLRFIEDETVSWLLRPGFLGQNGAMPMKFEDIKGLKNNAGAADPLKPNQLFFNNGAAQGRFKFLGHVKRKVMNPAINVEEEIVFARVEDQKPNKDKKVYEIPAPLKAGDRAKHIQHDRSAVLVLEALGQGGKQFVIEENTRFSLPAGQAEKPYLLKSVTPDKIVVEFPIEGGLKREVEIAKGGVARL